MHCSNYFVRNTSIALMLSLELAAVGCSGQSSSPGNNNKAAAGKQKALVQDAASATLAGADSLPAADPESVPNPTTAADPALEPNSTAVNNPPPEQNLGALSMPIPLPESEGFYRYNSINVILKRSLAQPQNQPSKSTTQTLTISKDFASDQAPLIKDVPPGNYDVSVTLRGRFLRTGSGSVTIDAGKTTTATVQVGCQPGFGPGFYQIPEWPNYLNPRWTGATVDPGFGINYKLSEPAKTKAIPDNIIGFFEICASLQGS